MSVPSHPSSPASRGQNASEAEAEAEAEVPLERQVPASASGQRFDAVAAQLFTDYSRSRLQEWIVSGRLTIDGRQGRTRARLMGGERLCLQLPASGVDLWTAQGELLLEGIEAEPVPLNVLFQDASICIINKAANQVMHPAPGNRHGTVLQGLLFQDPALRAVPRAGIVHRLDKDTTGLCVVARTLKAHAHLVDQLQQRSMGREYLALVLGDPPDAGTIEAPVGRHPIDRKRMAVVSRGKPATTHFTVEARYPGCALLRVRLETGRTHQIRVHMTHNGFPLLGDRTYRSRGIEAGLPLTLKSAGEQLGRQALHATRLSLTHPVTEEICQFEAPPPATFVEVLELLAGS